MHLNTAPASHTLSSPRLQSLSWAGSSQNLVSELRVIALMMDAASTSETLVNFHQTSRRYNPEDSHLRTRRRENLEICLPPLVYTSSGCGTQKHEIS
jgi:hypothetical protein